MFRKIFFSLVLVFLAAKAPVASATTIGTTGSATTAIGYFGTGGFSAFGESLKSPGGMLTSLTFSSIDLYSGANARLVIASLTGTVPGAALYSSQYTLVNGSNTFSNLNVSTTAGLNYFAYLTVDGVTSNAVKYASFGALTPGTNYSNGSFYYGDTDCKSIQQFAEFAKYDLAFSATFATPAVAVTPEPSSLMLLATGLMSTGTMLRRRKNAAV
ncbi:MAG: PEP-CTERM sorting domain-containing protein [Janthinobacterium lividum]